MRTIYFNPRSPCGERPNTSYQRAVKDIFQSTLPVWGATFCAEIIKLSMGISIHAPRVGSDLLRYQLYAFSTISIHAPRVGSDLTESLDTATPLDFNPRSPCGERPKPYGSRISYHTISIHAPRVGSDSRLSGCGYAPAYFNPRSPCGERRNSQSIGLWNRYFNPRSPCGERHAAPAEQAVQRCISIHAPRVGSDTRTPVRWTRPENFNPRSPCGERPLSRQLGDCCCEFQSTLPVWGATIGQRLPCPDATISIHAPRVGSDPVPTMRPTVITNFNPRSPCGERLILIILS